MGCYLCEKIFYTTTVALQRALIAPALTKKLWDASVDVENVVAEQWCLLRVPVMLSQNLIEQPLTLEEVVCTAGQTATHLHHQLIGQELETVHCCWHPLIGPEGEGERSSNHSSNLRTPDTLF